MRNGVESGGNWPSAEERRQRERRSKERAAIEAVVVEGKRRDCSQHLRKPVGCTRHESAVAEAGRAEDSKTATDGHSRRRRAAERGRREWDRSRSLSARAWTTRIGELAGRRVYRWSEHTAALVDHATGVGSGGYTT